MRGRFRTSFWVSRVGALIRLGGVARSSDILTHMILSDPLMATLMKNPVILPVSRVTVDQSTIRAVLLSNNKDPFNNVP